MSEYNTKALTFDFLTTIPEEQRRGVVEQFQQCREFREAAIRYLAAQRRQIRETNEGDVSYSSPAWAEKQAANNARCLELGKVIKMLAGQDKELQDSAKEIE